MGAWVVSKIPSLSPRASGYALSPWAAEWYFWYHPRAHMVFFQSLPTSLFDEKFQCIDDRGVEVKTAFLHNLETLDSRWQNSCHSVNFE